MAHPFIVVGGDGLLGLSEGTKTTGRSTSTGALVVGHAHGEHYEAVSRGNVYYAITATAGVAHGTSLSTTAAFWLHNPIGSDVYLSVISAAWGFVSGTIGGGTTFFTSHVGKQVTNPSGTAIVPRSTRLGGMFQGRALAFTTATVATQIAIEPAWNLVAMATTMVTQPMPCKVQVDGRIVVAPGFGVGLHSVASGGTTPLCRLAMTWEEVPVAYDAPAVRTL